MRNESCDGCSYYAASRQYQVERSHPASRGALPDGHYIIELNPEIEAAVQSVLELCERGKLAQAEVALKPLLREHPGNHLVCFAQGLLHAMKKEPRQAIDWFDRAIAIYPYFAEAYFNKAVVYQKQLNIAASVQTYQKLVELCNPKDDLTAKARDFLKDMASAIRKNEGVDLDTYVLSQNLFDQAYARMELYDWSGALEGFRASAQKLHRNATLHGNMGLCLAAQGFKAQALAELDFAIAIDPEYAPARSNRIAIQTMREGVPFDMTGFARVEYSKSKFLDRLG